jgi:predicted MFS family arabinose efflux permease
MTERDKLWTPSFILLNLQFMAVTCVTALFFPFHAYLGHLGFSQEEAGFLIGADALSSLLVQPLVALLIHPGSARRWLAGGSLLFAGALFCAGESTAFAPLLAARLLQGAGFSCVVCALISLIVESIPPQMSGQAFGWTSLVRLVPYAVIPPLFDYCSVPPAAFGQVLHWAALLALAPIGMAFIFRWRQAPPAAQAKSTPVSVAPGMAGALASLRRRPVVLLMLASLMLYSGYAAVFYYLRELAVALGMANSGLFFSLAMLTMILTRLFGGPLFDRYDKVRLSTVGLVIVTASYAVLPLAGQAAIFFALALSLGLGWGIVMPLQAALMFDNSPANVRGLNQNLLLAMMQAGFFAGPAVAGIVLSGTGFRGLFVATAAATAVAALATAALYAGKGRHN